LGWRLTHLFSRAAFWHRLELLVSNLGIDMEREELEKLIEEKVTKGGMPCGLYDTGTGIVHVYLDDVVGDTVCFRWHDHPQSMDAYIDY